MTSNRPSLPAPPRAPAEEGSAYMIVLMLLFVLTIVGVALSIVTQTEIIVGSNERTIQRVFYAAESGFNVARVRAGRGQLKEFVFDVKGSASNAAATVNAVDRVGVYPVILINYEYCNLSDAGSIYKLNYAVRVEATRLIGETGAPKNPVELLEAGLTTSATDGGPVASKTIAAMAEFNCKEPPPNDEILPAIGDPAIQQKVLAKVSL